MLDGAAARSRANDDVKEFYLGLAAADRRSFKPVEETYKRRKRWLA